MPYCKAVCKVNFFLQCKTKKRIAEAILSKNVDLGVCLLHYRYSSVSDVSVFIANYQDVMSRQHVFGRNACEIAFNVVD